MRWMALVLLLNIAPGADAQTAHDPSFVGPPGSVAPMRPVVEWAAIPACLPPRPSTLTGPDRTSAVHLPVVRANLRLLGSFHRGAGQAPRGADEWIDSSRGETLRAGVTPTAERETIAWLLTDLYVDSTGQRRRMHCGDCAWVTSRCRLAVGAHEAALADVRVDSFAGYEGIEVWLLWPAQAGAWRYITLAAHDSTATRRFEAAMRTVKIE